MPVFFCTRRISDGDLQGWKMRRFVNILLWAWQVPQNVVGLVFRLIYGRPTARYRGVAVVVSNRFPGGISLGSTIVVKRPYRDNPDTWDHEYGHTRQSLYLGPLYLLVIGIPSLSWAWWHRTHKDKSYYWFYTEKWADRLGGVVR